MSTDSTILQLLSAGGAGSTAIAAPSVRPLTYGELRDQVKCTVGTLNDFGVGRNDRVAIVLPNGPEMATAFVGIAAGASAAPLNPGYRIEEFEFYLSDLGAKALVVEQGSPSPARQVALRLGILVLELKTDSDPGRGAGAFTLSRCLPRPRQLPREGSRRPVMWRSCCTPRAPLPGRSWCR